jgi:hypothetical protein
VLADSSTELSGSGLKLTPDSELQPKRKKLKMNAKIPLMPDSQLCEINYVCANIRICRIKVTHLSELKAGNRPKVQGARIKDKGFRIQTPGPRPQA